MAEGLMRNLADNEYDVFSAGTNPKGLHPMTVEVMRDLGIEIGHQKSKDVSIYFGQHFDFVITVCDRARQHCPVFPGSDSIHWGLDDPAEADVTKQRQAFSRVRDEIGQRIRLFLAANRD